MNVSFKPIKKSDLAEVTAIYNYYVENSTATFHLQAVTDQEMEQTLCLGHPIYQSFVILFDDKILVKLGLSQQIKIEITETNKIIIKDKLLGWNFLTGMIEMSLKNAIIYNLIGLSFAVQGLLSPMIAAILMPISSISILLISFGFTNLTAKWLSL